LLASQALQRVLGIARQNREDVGPAENDEEEVEFAHDEEALALCEQILTVAVPIARFRCFVTIEKISMSNRSKLGLGDFTVCGLDIPSIKNGLIGLSMEPVSVYIQLWEHRDEGKFDMLCGYQGQTKNLGFRNWLRDIDRHNELTDQPTNAVQQRFNGGTGKKAAERFDNATDPRESDDGSSQS
jgi:hypothetical protein